MHFITWGPDLLYTRQMYLPVRFFTSPAQQVVFSLKSSNSPSSHDAAIKNCNANFVPCFSVWPLPPYLGGPLLNLLGYSWCDCRWDPSLQWFSSYMLCPPVALASLGFLQSKGLPLNSCAPPVPMFVKSLEPEQTLISGYLLWRWVSALELALLQRIWSDSSASLPTQGSWSERSDTNRQLK